MDVVEEQQGCVTARPEREGNYYSVIPYFIMLDDSLSPSARLLWGILDRLTGEKGYCWATNHYLADMFRCSKDSVSRWIGELKSAGYIRVQVNIKPGTFTERLIYVIRDNPAGNSQTPSAKNDSTLGRNAEHNNIKNNISNKKTSCPAKYKFTPEDRIIAGEIFEFARSVTPDLKKPNAEAWANEVRLLRTVDNKTHQQIRDRLVWISKDNFWLTNIQSPSGLRKNWDTMSAQANVVKEKTSADLQEEEYQLALKESRERKSNEYVEQR